MIDKQTGDSLITQWESHRSLIAYISSLKSVQKSVVLIIFGQSYLRQLFQDKPEFCCLL